MPLKYVKGDATQPEGEGPKVIVHCCNNLGRWGAGFTAHLSKRWPSLKAAYVAWYKRQSGSGEVTAPMGLGEVQFVKVEDDLWVANLIGQHGVGMGSDGRPPIRYEGIKKGLAHVCRFAGIHGTSIHMPKMGAGLAGGHWGNVEQLVKNELCNRGLEVTVYEL